MPTEKKKTKKYPRLVTAEDIRKHPSTSPGHQRGLAVEIDIRLRRVETPHHTLNEEPLRAMLREELGDLAKCLNEGFERVCEQLGESARLTLREELHYAGFGGLLATSHLKVDKSRTDGAPRQPEVAGA